MTPLEACEAVSKAGILVANPSELELARPAIERWIDEPLRSQALAAIAPALPYEQIDAVNFSTLKAMAISPLHYRHAVSVPREDTDAMALGRLMHAMVFEPETIDSRYVVWDGGRRAGKAWDAFVAEHAGKEILRAPQDWERAEAVRDAVLAHPVAAGYLEAGKAEQTLCWTDVGTGVACKGRTDWTTPKHVIVDLKTTRSISHRDIQRSLVGLSYHAQAAMYCDGYRAMMGHVATFAWIYVEQFPPHDVAVYTCPSEVLIHGRDLYRGWLEMVASCRASGVWPGTAPDEIEMSLPAWAVAEPAAEFGLNIGGMEVTL